MTEEEIQVYAAQCDRCKFRGLEPIGQGKHREFANQRLWICNRCYVEVYGADYVCDQLDRTQAALDDLQGALGDANVRIMQLRGLNDGYVRILDELQDLTKDAKEGTIARDIHLMLRNRPSRNVS
jgi:hypothetical protein